MKTLKEYIIEGILDIEDNIENLTRESLIEDFIKENYEIKYGNLQIKKNRDKYIVSTKGTVLVKNKNITALTNGVFEWGEVNSFYCSNCTSLESLEGAPEEVGKYFSCAGCTLLKNLIGAPKKVGESFICSDCTSLKDLKGAPKEVEGFFNCNGCTSLKSLEGAPKEVGSFFACSKCTSLKSLEGAPKKVGNFFDCERCGKKFTEEDVEKVCNVTSRVIYV